MSLEQELIELVKSFPEFSAPIFTALNVSPTNSVASLPVLRRLTYDQAGQDAGKTPFIPYLYWTGPFNSNPGQTNSGQGGTKKEDFWFWCNQSSQTKAMMWANSIRDALLEKFKAPQPVFDLITLRITGAFFIDCHPVPKDQVIITSDEFAISQAMIGFTFGYQNLSG